MKTTLIFLILFSTCAIYAQTDDKETLKKLNWDVIGSYKNRKFDEALKSAQQAVDLSIKINGAENLETAAAYTNLGVIYREKEDYKTSVENLQKATDIYRKNSKTKVEDLVSAYETLAFSQTLSGQANEAESSYLQAIKIAEDKNGVESKESFSPTLNLANFYVRESKLEKADEMYLKSYTIAIKNFGKETVEIERIENERSCFISRKKFDFTKQKSFYEERTKRFGELIEQGGSISSKTKGGLPKPRFSIRAKEEKAGGSVPVRLRIDENGNVTEAKAVCGNPLLTGTSEDAAEGAKFEKLIVNGKSIKYSGIIFYHYVPQ